MDTAVRSVPPESRLTAAQPSSRRPAGWALLPLRGYLAVVFLYAGISKIADTRFLDSTSPTSLPATLAAVRGASPIGSWLGPVAEHSFAFGVLMAFAEIAVGIGMALGLLTRVAALGGMIVALSLWLTVSWGAQPWYTSADLVYLFAFTPLLLAGAGAWSLDAWLASVRTRRPGVGEDRFRRAILIAGAVLVGGVVAAGATLFRRVSPTPSSRPTSGNGSSTGATLASTSEIPVGGGKEVTDPTTGDPTWILQLSAGAYTAYDAACPHQGCPVTFVSGSVGFRCPCHGSTFASDGSRTGGPAPSGLRAVAIRVDGTEIRHR
jgi:thiosulfate dehydrogenase (quinone) large subunit